MKAEYHADMEECTAATRQALRDLDYVITGGELHESVARIDARSDLADLVRITIASHPETGQSLVSFYAGRDWANEDGGLVQKLQDAFERRLRNPTGNQL
jgi:hypothetical protein